MKSLNEEKNSVDLVTDAMYSISFLDTFNKTLFNPETNKVSIEDFYTTWLHVSEASEPKMPFSLGIFTGYLFCGLLITKENWSELLPDKKISELEDEWGLMVLGSEDSKISYFIRHLRNSLAHTNFTIHVPEPKEMNSIKELHNLVKFTFTDVDPKNPKDIFKTTLSMSQLEKLIKKFHSIVHQSVRCKKDDVI